MLVSSIDTTTTSTSPTTIVAPTVITVFWSFDSIELSIKSMVLYFITSFTIEAWIYPLLLTVDRGIFCQYVCSRCKNQYLYFICQNNRLYVSFISNDLSGVSPLFNNNWYHVAFVYNYQTQQQQILYLNGVQYAIKSNAAPYQGNNESIQLGSTQVNGGYSLYHNGIYFGTIGNIVYGFGGLFSTLYIDYSNTCCSTASANSVFQGAIIEVYVHNRELTQAGVTLLANPLICPFF